VSASTNVDERVDDAQKMSEIALVAIVQQIVKRSRDQAVMSAELRSRAEEIDKSSQRTKAAANA